MNRSRGISERVKGSGVFWIRWTDAAGRRHHEKVGRFGDAENLLAKRKREVILGKKMPETLRTKPVLFSELCEDALKYSRSENSPKQTYELDLRLTQVKAAFGNRRADSIRTGDVLSWLNDRTAERKWSPATRNRWQSTFSLVFRVGLDNEKIERNPAARIRKRTEGGGRIRFLSAPEEKRLRSAIERRFAEFLPHFLLSIHTGMRMSEQYGLRWNQVDFERRQLHLIRTKNGDSRTIPLNAIALAALRELQNGKGQPGMDPVFPSVRTRDSLQGSRGWFSTALDEAKVLDYTWHCNRHTFASRLVMAGVDLRTVAELLGHRTLQMVMRYAHLAPEHQALAVDRLVPAGARMVTRSATGKSVAKNPKQTQTLTH